MGSTQSTNNHNKRYRAPSSTKSIDNTKYKRVDRFRTTMRSITLRALAARTYHNSVSSSNGSTINNSSLTFPYTINSQFDTDPYLSDFDYRKLSTLTGLAESKINELHREFLILSHNGRLSYERFKSMLESIPIQRTSAQLDAVARQTFALFDKDGNNYLDFAEFIAAYITMEKNDLYPHNESINKDPSNRSRQPTITSTSRQPATYYSPPKTLVNASPIISNRTPYLSNNYASYYPQSSEQYVYVSPSQYTFR
jgi:hypothetical protein